MSVLRWISGRGARQPFHSPDLPGSRRLLLLPLPAPLPLSTMSSFFDPFYTQCQKEKKKNIYRTLIPYLDIIEEFKSQGIINIDFSQDHDSHRNLDEVLFGRTAPLWELPSLCLCGKAKAGEMVHLHLFFCHCQSSRPKDM